MALLLTVLLCTWLPLGVSYTKGFPNADEPTCAVLRTMWNSSRQISRTAEITNSIPLYKDWLAHNKLESNEERLRFFSERPVYYGKMVYSPVHVNSMDTLKTVIKPCEEAIVDPHQCFYKLKCKTPRTPFQISDAGGVKYKTGLAPGSVAGSFDYLKKLIKNERLRDGQKISG